jgi:hypothetical protein
MAYSFFESQHYRTGRVAFLVGVPDTIILLHESVISLLT